MTDIVMLIKDHKNIQAVNLGERIDRTGGEFRCPLDESSHRILTIVLQFP